MLGGVTLGGAGLPTCNRACDVDLTQRLAALLAKLRAEPIRFTATATGGFKPRPTIVAENGINRNLGLALRTLYGRTSSQPTLLFSAINYPKPTRMSISDLE